MKNNQLIAIIPARANSKGIKGKNLVTIKGKPLIGYTIEAAIKANCFGKICITTDCPRVRKFASSYKDIDIIKRPKSLAKDNSKTIDAVNHVLNFYKKKGHQFDDVMLLQPTSPLRTSLHIKSALNIYIKNNSYRSLVSFSGIKEHPYKCFFQLENNKIKSIFGDSYLSRPRQLLPKVIKQNGAIYINRVKDLINKKTFFTKPIFPFIMNELSSVDVDEKADLLYVKYCMKEKRT